ncbi:MAG: PEP-utilizing enzyme [Clostridia bacterium]|nr:PEP-utilizing enzyme [Clostridia bacterium]
MGIYKYVPGYDFDEGIDFEHSPCWFLDGTHSLPAWTPMFGWFWSAWCSHGTQYATRALSIPTVKGWDWRLKDGCGYIRILTVKDPDEIRRREEQFRDAIKPFISGFDEMWKTFVDEITGRYRKLRSLDLAEASNTQLLDCFEDTISTCRRMWEIHMYMMYGVYTAFTLLEDLTNRMFGINDRSPEFCKLISGFDNKSFQVDKGLFDLARKAKEMGFRDIFLSCPLEKLREILGASQDGRDFLNSFDEFIENEAGWRMERMAEINVPTWWEDPTPAFNIIKIALGEDLGYSLDEKRQRQEIERKAIEDELIGKITPEQRGWFQKILKLAQSCSRFSEEHNHYLDLYTHALIRRVTIEIGRRFASAGAIEVPEDIFFLIPDEVRKAGINPDLFNLRKVVERRKSDWQKWCKSEHPPILAREGFSVEEAAKMLEESHDPLVMKVLVGSMPVQKPGLKADLFGTCGSPGFVEGKVKLAFTEKDLVKIEKGDILVAPTTSPSWTPVFSLLKGIIIDRGASLSHAAIVGREYGIPVLINVFDATKILKDGMTVRLDANMGSVLIL